MKSATIDEIKEAMIVVTEAQALAQQMNELCKGKDTAAVVAAIGMLLGSAENSLEHVLAIVNDVATYAVAVFEDEHAKLPQERPQ